MLEEKDLQAIKSIVEDVVDKRISESENLILKYVDDTRKTFFFTGMPVMAQKRVYVHSRPLKNVGT